MSEYKSSNHSGLFTALCLLVPVILSGVVAYGYFTGLSIQVLLPILLVLTVVLFAAIFLIMRSVRRRKPVTPDDQPR